MNTSDCKHLYAAIVKMDKKVIIEQNRGDLYVSLFEQTKNCDHVFSMSEERKTLREFMQERQEVQNEKTGDKIVQALVNGSASSFENKLATDATEYFSWTFDSYLKNVIPLTTRAAITLNDFSRFLTDCWIVFRQRKIGV